MWCWCAFPTHPSIPRRRRSRHLCCFESKQMSRPTSFWPSWTKLKTASEIQSWGKPFSVLSWRSPIFSDFIIFTICTIKIPSSRRPCFSRNPPLIQYKSVKTKPYVSIKTKNKSRKNVGIKTGCRSSMRNSFWFDLVSSDFIGDMAHAPARNWIRPSFCSVYSSFVRFSLQRLLSPL